MARTVAIASLALALLGCETAPPDTGLDSDGCPRAPRVASAQLAIGADGRSEPMTVAVPGHTRGLSIEIEGEELALHALASLRLADGDERVPIPAGTDLRALLFRIADERVAPIPYGVHQIPTRGFFSYLAPSTAADPLACGVLTVRALSQSTDPVRMTVRLPEDDGAAALHLSAFWVSDAAQPWPLEDLVAAAQASFDPAGIRLVLDASRHLAGTDFDVIEDGPPTGRSSEMSALARAGAALVSPAGVQVFVVEDFAGGGKGYSLGVPGPSDPASPLNGVFVRNQADLDALGRRMLAHELGHFLGLHHVENRGDDGTRYPDPLDDTAPGLGNLMDAGEGSALSIQQIAVLHASPLLARD